MIEFAWKWRIPGLALTQMCAHEGSSQSAATTIDYSGVATKQPKLNRKLILWDCQSQSLHLGL